MAVILYLFLLTMRSSNMPKLIPNEVFIQLVKTKVGPDFIVAKSGPT